MGQPSDGPATERRRVEVADPRLSPELNRRLTAQLRELVGHDEVDVPADRPRVSRGETVHGDEERTLGTSASLMAVISGFAAVSVGGIVATAETNSFWWLGLAMLLDVVGVVVVAANVMRMTSVTERPDSVSVADMQTEGISDPERYFTDVVAEFSVAVAEPDGHRHAAVEEDHVQAAAEQRRSMTPTGGPSRAVGPGE